MTNGVVKGVHTLVPAVDIVETKNSYIVKLDIPGAAKDKIKAQIEDNSLRVSASIAEYGESGKESEPVKEYRREFALANDVDVNTIDAQYDLGVLTITLNKKVQFLPKEITIN
ncbi:MAG: Hsp20/alpha crystallin family protein [Ignavibacteriales bacterium]|nr:Hsp20/alpha crystallin family protein [Ignavibacteriales bacterium]